MNSSITIYERERVIISGVISVNKVTDESVSVFTDKGDLLIQGIGLDTETFDPGSGLLRVNGRIDSVCFTTEKDHLPDNIISRLFR